MTGWNTGVVMIFEKVELESAPDVKVTADWFVNCAGVGTEVTSTLNITVTVAPTAIVPS